MILLAAQSQSVSSLHDNPMLFEMTDNKKAVEYTVTSLYSQNRSVTTVYFSFFLGLMLLVCPHFLLRQLVALG